MRRRGKPPAARPPFRGVLGAVAIAGVGLAAAVEAVPPAVAGWYSALSLVAYVAYWLDKAAAGRGGRRTPENTLHMLGLLGGWPGALVAQQQFRHKTAKQPFQLVFWGTALANLAAAAWWMASTP